jgi:hypothetical protein
VNADRNAPLHEIPTGAFGTKPSFSHHTDDFDPASGLRGPNRAAGQQAVRSLPLWLRRIRVLLFVAACGAIGVVLIILPWRAEWTDNYLLVRYPELRIVVASGFFRGVCTGLGLLNVWLGFWEAVHYHEEGR